MLTSEILLSSRDSSNAECNVFKFGDSYIVAFFDSGTEIMPNEIFMSIQDACCRVMKFWFDEYAGAVEDHDPVAYIKAVNTMIQANVVFDKGELC